MKKYKLLKELPGLEIGTIIEVSDKNEVYPEGGHNANVIYITCDFILGLLKHNITGWLEEIKEPKNIYNLEEGDEYYYIGIFGELRKNGEDGIELYKNQFSHLKMFGNIFLTKQEAEKELKKRKALAKIKKWIWENNAQLCDDGYIILLQELEIITVKNYTTKGIGDIIFKKEEDAEKCLEECKQEWKILFDLI